MPLPKNSDVCKAAMPSVAPSIGTSMCVPWPLAWAARKADAMAKAPYRPAEKSATGTPHFTGSPPASPVTLMMPLMAWMVRSKPPSCERGPDCP
ncbi:hypothetical protein D3C73_1309940 [compost metagenome]